MCFLFQPFLVNVVPTDMWMSKHVEGGHFLKGRISSYSREKNSLTD